MSVIRIATNFNIDLEFTAASFGRRLIAWALDLLLQIFYLIAAFRFLHWLMQGMNFSNDSDYNLWAITLLLMLPFFLYHLVCEVTMNGQSVGKRIMGIRVVNATGGRPAVSQFVIRWLIRTSDFAVLLMLLNAPYAMMFGEQFFKAMGASLLLLFSDVVLVNSTKKHQRLGDILAHTILISTKQTAAIEDTLFWQVADNYVPKFPEVMRLSDRDMNSLKSLLDTANKRNDYELAERASNRIKNYLSIQSDQSAFELLETLLKDYNYLAST